MRTVKDQVQERIDSAKAFDEMPWQDRLKIIDMLGIGDDLWSAARDKLDVEYEGTNHGIGSSDVNHTAMAMFRNIWCEARRTAADERRMAAQYAEHLY